MAATELQRSPAPSTESLLPGLEEDLAVAEVREAIATAAAVKRSPEEDAQAAARRAAIDIATAALTAGSAETAAHSDDVDIISEGIGRRLGLSGSELEDVMIAARLHDIGKLGVPRRVIEKPAPLDATEWGLIRRHTVIGEQILLAVPELRSAARLVRFSHERWDGRGYPDGLAEEQIPLGSRIVFCADAYHAIRSDRAYRRGRPAAEALAEIRSCAGTQFDPTVVEALVGLTAELRAGSASRRVAFGRSKRLMALMLVISVGACGSALARTGVVPDAKQPLTPAAENGANPAAPAASGLTGVSAQPVGTTLLAPAAGPQHGGERTGLALGPAQGLVSSVPAQLTIPALSAEAPIAAAATPAAVAAPAGPAAGPETTTTPTASNGDGAQAVTGSEPGAKKAKPKKGGASSGNGATGSGTASTGKSESSETTTTSSGKTSSSSGKGSTTGSGSGSKGSSGSASSSGPGSGESTGKGSSKGQGGGSGTGTAGTGAGSDDPVSGGSGAGKLPQLPKPPKPPKPPKGGPTLPPPLGTQLPKGPPPAVGQVTGSSGSGPGPSIPGSGSGGPGGGHGHG